MAKQRADERSKPGRKTVSRKPAKPAGKSRCGRPSKCTPEVVAAICDRLSTGETLVAICRHDGMPNPSTVWDWAQARPEVSQALARAREAGHDAIADGCLEIADDARNDWMLVQGDAGDGYRLNGEHVQRSKLRIETRLKLLAVWNPKKYGAKVDVSAKIEPGQLTDEQLQAQIAQLIGKPGVAELVAAAMSKPSDADA